MAVEQFEVTSRVRADDRLGPRRARRRAGHRRTAGPRRPPRRPGGGLRANGARPNLPAAGRALRRRRVRRPPPSSRSSPPTRIGLLYRVTRVFASFDLDVRTAKMQTLGDLVVDAFYLTHTAASWSPIRTCASRSTAPSATPSADRGRRRRRARVACGGWAGTITESDLLRWSETLAGIARTGLGFTENLYERERFEEVLAVAADIHHATSVGADIEQSTIVHDWLRSVGEGVAGYVTPKVAVGAIVGNDEGELLLVKRVGLGHLAVPDRLGRHRLLAGRGGGEGGLRGDRHQVRGAADCSPCFDGTPPRVHPHPALLAGVPLPGDRRRAHAAPAGDRRRRLLRPRRPARAARRLRPVGRHGVRRARRASSSPPGSTCPATRPGWASTDAARAGDQSPRRKRSTSSTSASGSARREEALDPLAPGRRSGSRRAAGAPNRRARRRLVVGVLGELGDVGRGLVVGLDQLVDLALVGRGGDLEVGGRRSGCRAAPHVRLTRA